MEMIKRQTYYAYSHNNNYKKEIFDRDMNGKYDDDDGVYLNEMKTVVRMCMRILVWVKQTRVVG